MDNNSLTHHGILGMKWGKRRYQNKDGSLTEAGKKRYAEEEAAREAAKKAYEEGKQRAIKSGSASEVLKYRGDLTKQEMDEARNRLNWERDIANLKKEEIDAGQKFITNTDKLVRGTQSLAKLYNMGANIYNAFNGAEGKSLPKIELDIVKSNKDIRKAEKKAREEKKAAEDKKAKDLFEAEKKKKDAENLAKAQKQVDDYNAKIREQYEREASQYRKVFKRNSTVSDISNDESTSRGESYASRLLSGKVQNDSSTKTYTGTVVGEGTSKATRFNSSSTKKNGNSDYIIDGSGLFKDITDSPKASGYITSGQSYVAGLLGEPKR